MHHIPNLDLKSSEEKWILPTKQPNLLLTSLLIFSHNHLYSQCLCIFEKEQYVFRTGKNHPVTEQRTGLRSQYSLGGQHLVFCDIFHWLNLR
jgi:hypothetical protein